ncbi:MAG: DUF6111 family protein [Alphaproteobacteria bacterium]
MRRLLLNYLLPLLLPFAVYGVWLYFARRQSQRAGAAGPAWRDAPWTWLLIAGVGLVIVGFIVLGAIVEGPPDATYIPPHMVDGEIVPGKLE